MGIRKWSSARHFLQSTSYKVRPRHLQLKGKNRSRALKRRRSFEKDHSFVLGKTKIFTLKVEQPKAFLITFCAQKVIVLELYKKFAKGRGNANDMRLLNTESSFLLSPLNIKSRKDELDYNLKKIWWQGSIQNKQ